MLSRTMTVPAASAGTRHAIWVRWTHWVAALGVLVLAVSGTVILMAHPRLYWGEAGNDLMPALLELPISRNHRHGGWEAPAPFVGGPAGPVSASRTFPIFNQNGWARSLQFLAAWVVVLTGVVYLGLGVWSRHIGRHLLPAPGEWSWHAVVQEIRAHARLAIRAPTGGPQYGLLQKCAYASVVLVALPTLVMTGLAMSPAITTAYPWLGRVWGGFQSARTIHFATFVLLVVFTVLHVSMVCLSGWRRQLRGMTIGERP